MSEPLAPLPRRLAEPPLTLEAEAQFRVRAAGAHGPALAAAQNGECVVIEAEDGVVVFPASDKLVILDAERAKRGR